MCVHRDPEFRLCVGVYSMNTEFSCEVGMKIKQTESEGRFQALRSRGKGRAEQGRWLTRRGSGGFVLNKTKDSLKVIFLLCCRCTEPATLAFMNQLDVG